jgi:Leucine-rich repeat (LRR) protein
MTKNNITSGTLYYNGNITWLSLAKNNINNVQPLASANQSMLQHLDLSGNGISGVNNSTFSMHRHLQTLILSDNKLEHIDSKYFSACRNLQNLFVAGNNISYVDNKTFHELKQLHQLDLSSNNIKELELLVCYNCSAHRPEHQYRVSTPKYVNLSRNTIQSFHLLHYLPSNQPKRPVRFTV